MKFARRTVGSAWAIVLFSLAFGGGWSLAAKYETIQAVMQGEGTQLGRRTDVKIIIYEYSTDDDQKALQEAFQAAGSEGLFNALTKMKAKGHMAITGTLGFDVNYIREFQVPEGRKIRLVTDRPIRFGEAWHQTRSTDYNLSACDVILSKEKGKSTGTIIPALELKLDPKTNQIVVEAYKNPWRLLNINYYPVKK
ncbi:MAG TPA: hypothetical protein PLN26_12610 [Acidobacteriota bacterium]|nr:hypothetical protein [Acidobacteriota bacterium]HQF88068.1 hypothetical protein [Acidobacteriota bacterium]HQG92122.1 hypothetical protein [Acidobacteriota bacterium]HQK86362.1 hypothetical protein [Acidobacteriota bacterium]